MHKLSGDAVALGAPRTPMHYCRKSFAVKPQNNTRDCTLSTIKFRNSIFANQGFAKAGKPESRTETARRSLHAGKDPMECVGKTCCAATESAAYGKFVSSFRFLELAKGFEPPTL